MINPNINEIKLKENFQKFLSMSGFSILNHLKLMFQRMAHCLTFKPNLTVSNSRTLGLNLSKVTVKIKTKNIKSTI